MLAAPSLSPDGQRIAYQRNGFKPRSPLRIWISPLAGGMATQLLTAGIMRAFKAPTWAT